MLNRHGLCKWTCGNYYVFVRLNEKHIGQNNLEQTNKLTKFGWKYSASLGGN